MNYIRIGFYMYRYWYVTSRMYYCTTDINIRIKG